MLSIISLLTSVLGMVFRGPNAKGHAGGVLGALMLGAEPLVNSFQKGLIEGAGTSFEELGMLVGSLIGGWILGFIIPWATENKKG